MKTVQSFDADIFEQNELLDDMCRLITANMTELLGESQIPYQTSKAMWLDYYGQAVRTYARKTVVVRDGNVLCGFFLYSKTNGCYWDELQIATPYRRDGITIRLLLREFFRDPDYKDCDTIYAKVNAVNENCARLAARVGFVEAYAARRGTVYKANRAVLEKLKFLK